MDEFKAGDVVYHKATLYRCVVIAKNENGTYKVRDQANVEQNYYPQELSAQNMPSQSPPTPPTSPSSTPTTENKPFFSIDDIF